MHRELISRFLRKVEHLFRKTNSTRKKQEISLYTNMPLGGENILGRVRVASLSRVSFDLRTHLDNHDRRAITRLKRAEYRVERRYLSIANSIGNFARSEQLHNEQRSSKISR